MHITINQPPVPKSRPRMTKSGHVYTPQKTRDYEELVALLARIATHHTLDGPLKLTIDFYMPMPKSIKTKMTKSGQIFRPATKPDIDNLIKAVLDGMNGIAYYDDKQIVEIYCREFYSDNPRTEIELEEI